MWTDTAKALTLDAAVAAGLGSKDEIELMSEPDAAAAWTILKDIQSTHLKVRLRYTLPMDIPYAKA